jgi:demethylmenaquinone methyltransferase/2-methoxy-6-polyprenyl-1,4-benzoquinol methylase
MRAYYERRAAEYDDWWLGTGLFASRSRPGWDDDVAALVRVLRALPPALTVDLACGTGFLTRELPGRVVGVDQSETMVAIARSRGVEAVVGDALELPAGEWERVFTSHFYGHLDASQRARLLALPCREVVVVDSAFRGVAEEWQERVLNDGSVHRVYKRWFTASGLAAEIGGEELFDGAWFVAARRR